MTTAYTDTLESFVSKHDLELEILKEIKLKPKSINDYDTEEEYWDSFHQRNGRRYS